MSKLTRLLVDSWEDDGHSHSFLSRQEVYELNRWLEKLGGPVKIPIDYVCGCTFGYIFNREFTEYGCVRLPSIEDVRLVFWFDN